jgi:hypothetical protein
MKRLALATLVLNLLGFATLGLFGGAIVSLIIGKGSLAGQLALGGLGSAAATGLTAAYTISQAPKDVKNFFKTAEKDFFGDK